MSILAEKLSLSFRSVPQCPFGISQEPPDSQESKSEDQHLDPLNRLIKNSEAVAVRT
jgi:hypothetical protein